MSHPPRQQERTDAALRKGGKGNSGYQKQGVPNSGKSGGAGPGGGLRNPPPVSRSNKRTTNGPSSNSKGIPASEPAVVNVQTTGEGVQPHQQANQQRAITNQRQPASASAADASQATTTVVEIGEAKGGAPSPATASLPPTGTAGRGGGPTATTASHAVSMGPPPTAVPVRTSVVPAPAGPQSSTGSGLPSQGAGGGEAVVKVSGGNPPRAIALSPAQFQFGTFPQFPAVMQIPARTNSAPPNLIEQRTEQALFEASSAGSSKPPVVVAPQQSAPKITAVVTNVSHTANVHSQTNMQSSTNHIPPQTAHMQLHNQPQGASMAGHVQHPSHAPVQQMVIPSQQQHHHQKQPQQQQMQTSTQKQSLPPQSHGAQMAANMSAVAQAGKFSPGGHMMSPAHGGPMLPNQMGHISGQMMPAAINSQYGNQMQPNMSGTGGLQPRARKAIPIVDPKTNEEVKVAKRDSLMAGAGSEGGGMFVPGNAGIGPGHGGQQLRSGSSGSVPGTSPVLRPPPVAFPQPPMMGSISPFYPNLGPNGQPMAGPPMAGAPYYGQPGQPKPGVGVPGPPPGPSSGSPPVRYFTGNPANGVSGTGMPYIPHVSGSAMQGPKMMGGSGPSGTSEIPQGVHGATIIHGLPGVGVGMMPMNVGVPVRPGLQNPAMHGGGVGSTPRPMMPITIQGQPMGMPPGMKYGDAELASPTGLPPGFLSADAIGNPQGMIPHGPMGMMGIAADNRVPDMRRQEGFSVGFNNSYRNNQMARPVVNAPQRPGTVVPKPSTPPMGPGNQVGDRGKSADQGNRQGGVPVRDQQGQVGVQGQGGGKKKKELQRQQQQQGLQQRVPGQPHGISQPVVSAQHALPAVATPVVDVSLGLAGTGGVLSEKSSSSISQVAAAQVTKPLAGPGPSGPIATHDRRNAQSSTAQVPVSTRHLPGLKASDEAKQVEPEGLEKALEGEDDGEKMGVGKPVLAPTIKAGSAWGKGPPGSAVAAVELNSVVASKGLPITSKGGSGEALSVSGLQPTSDPVPTVAQSRSSTSGREGYAGQVREVRDQAWETGVGGKLPFLPKSESIGADQLPAERSAVGVKDNGKKQEVSKEVSTPVTSAWGVPLAVGIKVAAVAPALASGPSAAGSASKAPGKQAGLKKDDVAGVVSASVATVPKGGVIQEAVLKQTVTVDGRSVDGGEMRSATPLLKESPAVVVAAAGEVANTTLEEKDSVLSVVKGEDEKVSAGTVGREAPAVPAASGKAPVQGKDVSGSVKDVIAKETVGKSLGGKDGGKRGAKGREPSHESKIALADRPVASVESCAAGLAKDAGASDVTGSKDAKVWVTVATKGAAASVKDGRVVGINPTQKDSSQVTTASTGEDVQAKGVEPAKLDGGKGDAVAKEKPMEVRQVRNVPPKKRPPHSGGEVIMAEAKKESTQQGEKVAPVKDVTEAAKETEVFSKPAEDDQVLAVAAPAKPSLSAAVNVPSTSGEEKQSEGKVSSKVKDSKSAGKGKDGKKGEAGQAGKGDKKSAVENLQVSKDTVKEKDTKSGARGAVKAEASKTDVKEEGVVPITVAAPVTVPLPAVADVDGAKAFASSEAGKAGISAPEAKSAVSVAATAKVPAEVHVPVEVSADQGNEDADAMADFADVFAAEVSKEQPVVDGKGAEAKVALEGKAKGASPVEAKAATKVTGSSEADTNNVSIGDVKQALVPSVEDEASKKAAELAAKELVEVKEQGEASMSISKSASPVEESGVVKPAGNIGIRADEGDENGTSPAPGVESAATNAIAGDVDMSSNPVGGSKKKMKFKERVAKYEAEKDEDLFKAYKAPVEVAKTKDAVLSESATKEKPAPHLEEPVSKEVDDWEVAADMPTPKIGKKGAGGAGGSQGDARGPEHSSEDGFTSQRKYTRDFLLTFRDSNTDMPESLDPRDGGFLDLFPGHAARSMGQGGPRPGTPGRGGPMAGEDERWTRGAAGGRFPDGVLPGQPGGFRPGGGPAGRGGLMGPGGGRGMLGAPHLGFPPGGPFPPGMGPPGMMGWAPGANGIDADRWARNPQMVRGPGPPPRMNVPGPAIHKLSEEKRFVAGVITDEEQIKQKKVKGILNKLTPQNFDKLFEQVKEVGIDSASSLSNVISQIFEKALFEPSFCEMYAQFCQKLSMVMPEFTENNEKFTFKRVLLNKCQEEFERGKSEEADAEREDVAEGAPELSRPQKEEKLNKARQRTLGNIRLIGELYKKNMLTERIMHMCIQSLLGDVTATLHEEQIEALCKLMVTIGSIIDHSKAKSHMDSYFQRMENEANNMKLSLRHRFMLKDVIEQRANGWEERRKVDGPKKIADVHRDYAQERTSAVAAATASIQRGDRAASGRDRRGDRGPPPPQMRGAGGFQPVGPVGARGPRGQDARVESDSVIDGRYAGPARPLQAQRPSDDGDVRLGPQGGLGWGMGARGGAHGPSMGPGMGRDGYGMGGADTRRMNMPMSAQPGHGMMGAGPPDRGPGGGPDHGFMGSFRGGRGAESPVRGGRPDEPSAGGRGFYDRPVERPYTPDRGPRGVPGTAHDRAGVSGGPDRGYGGVDSRPSSRDGGREQWNAKASTGDRPGSSGQGAPPGIPIRPATPPQGGRVPPREPLSEADCIDKSKSILMELSRTGDLKEVGISMEELRAPEFHSKIVTSWLDQAIQKKEDVRVAFVKLILHLHQTSLLTKDDISKGFTPFLNDLDDLAVDAPKAPEQVATMLGAFIAGNILSVAEVGHSIIEAGPEDAPHALIESGRGLEMLGHILAKIRKEKGDAAALFKASGLTVESFMTEDEKKKVTVLENFLEANHMLDPMIPVQRHLAEELSKDAKQDDIIKWLQEHVASSMASEPAYFRMVLKEVLNKVFPKKEVSTGGEQLKKYAKLLKHVASGNKSSRLQTGNKMQYLFALQHFAHDLNHPSGFLKRGFEALYHGEVIDEDVLLMWKDDNKDTTPGKVQALKDTASFFKWLAEAEEAEEEEN